MGAIAYERRRLGRTELQVGVLGIGGDSERYIGIALQEWYRRGHRREHLIIESKAGSRRQPHDYSYDAIMASTELSLRALQTDYLDLMLVHDPAEIEPVLAPHAARDALLRLNSALGGVLEPAVTADVGVFNASIMLSGLLGGENPDGVAARVAQNVTAHRQRIDHAVWEELEQDWSVGAHDAGGGP